VCWDSQHTVKNVCITFRKRLGCPLTIAGGANVLELQIGRIRLNVNDILLRLIDTGFAIGIGASQGIHMGKCGIVECILINGDTGGRPRR
jgi:hypothetical protein